MEYTVEITIEAAAPLTIAMLERVAAIGGAAAGNVGDRRLETALTVAAEGPKAAATRGAARIRAICPGVVLAVEAMTTVEADFRNDIAT